MGRGYIVEDAVEGYLSGLCELQAGPIAGLLIGQCTPQRDFVILAARTPEKTEPSEVDVKSVDKEWVTEHARQVSRMLPGGLSVLGVFIVTDAEAKETLTLLRQLVFGVENLISSERLWSPAGDDVTDCVTLHINSKTRKTVCRTFDVSDNKSIAKPADWKYQSGVCSSWSMVSCCLNMDIVVPLPEHRTSNQTMDKCLKEGLKVWVHQIESGICLIDGKLPEDSELTAGQKRNTRQTHRAQLFITPEQQRLTAIVQQCGGSVSVRGAIHSRAYLQSNRPKARLAEKLLKRDVISTVTTRVQMLLEELLIAKYESNGSCQEKPQTEQRCLPRRVFCPIKGVGPVCVCDYQFSDESLSEVTDRLKEMMDINAAEVDLDTRQEITPEIIENQEESPMETKSETMTNNCIESPMETKPESMTSTYIGVALAGIVAMFASAASLLYFSDY